MVWAVGLYMELLDSTRDRFNKRLKGGGPIIRSPKKGRRHEQILFLGKPSLCYLVPEGGSQRQVTIKKTKLTPKTGEDCIVRAGHQGRSDSR